MKLLKKISIVALSLFLFNSCDENNSITEQDSIAEQNLPDALNFIGPMESFSDFDVYKLLDNNNLDIVLKISGIGRDFLNLNSEITTFSLPNNNLTIEISKWDRSVQNHFSNDAIIYGEEPIKLEAWSSISGTLKLSVSNVEISATHPEFTPYDISIRLENVLFQNTNGEQKLIESLDINNTHVGWFPG